MFSSGGRKTGKRPATGGRLRGSFSLFHGSSIPSPTQIHTSSKSKFLPSSPSFTSPSVPPAQGPLTRVLSDAGARSPERWGCQADGPLSGAGRQRQSQRPASGWGAARPAVPLALGGRKLWTILLVLALVALRRGAALWGKRLELPAEPGARRGSASGPHPDLLKHATFG